MVRAGLEPATARFQVRCPNHSVTPAPKISIYSTFIFQGHVNWDTAVPANLGYIASILWNQNNCAAEGSPVTTTYEIEAGGDLCEMIGLKREDSMGHLVAGGTIANIEAIWVARNLKYYPLGLQEALLNDGQLSEASGYQVDRSENKLSIYSRDSVSCLQCPYFVI